MILAGDVKDGDYVVISAEGRTRPDCRRNAAALCGSHSDDQLILINYQITKARVILTAVNVPGFLACINA